MMSRSSKAARAEQAPAPEQKKSLFKAPTGKTRAGWLLAASLLCYVLAALALKRGLTGAFNALFAAWGVNAENAARAPFWARGLYIWQGSLETAVVSAVLLALSGGLRRLWLGQTEGPGFSPKALFKAALAGLGVALLIAALALILDSMRVEGGLSAPRLTVKLPVLCAISLLAALSEEAFLKRVLFDGIRDRWGAAWAVGIACAMFFLSNGGYAGSVVSGVNVLLMGGVCCALYARRGLWAAAGFLWGWSVATVFLMGFGGGDASVYRLYGVSEVLLTGGDAGPIYGLWATLFLLGMLAVMEHRCLPIKRGRSPKTKSAAMAGRPSAPR